MKLGPMFIAIAIIQLLLMLFGIIDSNSLISVLLGLSTWKEFFSFDSLFSTENLLLSVTAVVGIVLKNSYVLFASLAIFVLDTIFGMSGIIGLFPEPFGHIIFGVISLAFTWLVLEWWRLNDQ